MLSSYQCIWAQWNPILRAEINIIKGLRLPNSPHPVWLYTLWGVSKCFILVKTVVPCALESTLVPLIISLHYWSQSSCSQLLKAMICTSSFITQQYVSTLENILLMIKHTELLLLAERLRYDPDRYTPVAAAAIQEMSLLHRAWQELLDKDNRERERAVHMHSLMLSWRSLIFTQWKIPTCDCVHVCWPLFCFLRICVGNRGGKKTASQPLQNRVQPAIYHDL